MYTIMNTVTLSARLTKDEAQKIDDLASALGLDRGSLLKQLIRKGYKELQIQRALDAYRRGKITLSRAAEIAEISLRDILLQLPEESIELSYDLRELQRDMENI
jgi:predicted HTH domain antitoxin